MTLLYDSEPYEPNPVDFLEYYKVTQAAGMSRMAMDVLVVLWKKPELREHIREAVAQAFEAME